MADRKLKAKIAEILVEGNFSDPDDAVYVLDGPAGNIHIVVISEKFRRRSLAKRNELIMSDLFDRVQNVERGKITLAKGMVPNELTTTI